MKRSWIVLITLLIVIISSEVGAQHRRRSSDPGGDRPEQLEKYRKMRLIEYLNLNEEDAIRFFAKHNSHEQKIRDVMEKRDQLVDEISEKIQKTANINEIGMLTEKIRGVDKEMFDERQRFQEDIKQILSPMQFAKFILFERDFGRKVRDAIRGLGPDHQPPPNQNE
jgi:hypothetical protein